METFISIAQDKAAVAITAILLAGLLVRGLLFARSLREGDASGIGYATRTLLRLLAPLHQLVLVRPCYSALRYLFHLGLLVVIIGVGSHAAVLKSLHLLPPGWDVPEPLVDRVSLLLICCLLFFAVRKLALPSGRAQRGKYDGAFLGWVALPVVTGYVAHHGWLDMELVLAIHLAAALAVTGSILFLFCRSTVATEKCTGCRACSVSCPTGALKAVDKGGERIFEYSHYQCVCCATCVRSCPEGAVTLRHRLGFRYAVEYHRVPDRVLPLRPCEECGHPFTSDNQLEQIGSLITDQGLELSSLYLCERCKRRSSLRWLRPQPSALAK